MNIPDVYVAQNVEVKFPSWICAHAAPQITEEPDTFVVCGDCSDLLDRGARMIEKKTGREIAPA